MKTFFAVFLAMLAGGAAVVLFAQKKSAAAEEAKARWYHECAMHAAAEKLAPRLISPENAERLRELRRHALHLAATRPPGADLGQISAIIAASDGLEASIAKINWSEAREWEASARAILPPMKAVFDSPTQWDDDRSAAVKKALDRAQELLKSRPPGADYRILDEVTAEIKAAMPLIVRSKLLWPTR